VAVTADLKAAEQLVSEWQKRCETLTAQNASDHDAELAALQQQLENTHLDELKNLANSRQY